MSKPPTPLEVLQAEVGKRHGKLTVTEYAGKAKRGDHTYRCTCDCGNTRIVTRSHLLGGSGTRVRACRECSEARLKKHRRGYARIPWGSEATAPQVQNMRGTTFQGGNPETERNG